MKRKREISFQAASAFEKLTMGDSVVFDIPCDQPGRRVSAQSINAEAYRIFGAGGYKMKSGPTGIEVTRTERAHRQQLSRLRGAFMSGHKP